MIKLIRIDDDSYMLMIYGRLVQIILLKFIYFVDFIVVKQSNMIVKLLVVTYKTMFIVGLQIHILRFEKR